MIFLKAAAAAVFAAGIVPASPALSAGSGNHSHGHGGTASATGTPGGTPTRTVAVTMYDNYYEPERIAVRHGETVKFVLTNAGSFLHEFSIATPEMHVAHQPHMAMMMEMEALLPDRINHAVIDASRGTGHDMSHDEPNSALVEPGRTADLVWTFDAAATLEFACNIPGHYESGMAGDIEIAR